MPVRTDGRRIWITNRPRLVSLAAIPVEDCTASNRSVIQLAMHTVVLNITKAK
jgi:hypothetical protein